MSSKHRSSTRYVTYEQLVEAWWDIHSGYAWCKNEAARTWMIRRAFEELLPQCGWTVESWNAAADP